MIELGKKYRTRDGREVRIYAVDGSGMYPVHGASNRPAGWCLERWTNTGELWANGKEDPYDLIEVQPERWHPIVVTLGNPYVLPKHYPTKESAMSMYPSTCIDAWLDPRSGK